MKNAFYLNLFSILNRNLLISLCLSIEKFTLEISKSDDDILHIINLVWILKFET